MNVQYLNSVKPADDNGYSSRNILLTIDVEDWFQVENFKPWIPFDSWDSFESRVEKNTHQILDLLDTIKANNLKTTVHTDSEITNRLCAKPSNKIKATFFVLGWIARRIPSLVQEIHSRGHEIASHGLNHQLCYNCSRDALKKDITDSKKLLEDITGQPVYGYRAPSFSVTEDVLELLQECGYYYDSSVNSFRGNNRYGKIDLSRLQRKGMASRYTDQFYELPISNLKRGGLSIPIGGGGYFRLLPFPLFAALASYFLKKEGAYLFYFHPWELDSGQPRVKESNGLSKFRHYYNISQGREKLSQFLDHFSTNTFLTCVQYLDAKNDH
jgi:polysaccharide deacetylase family protein (PEP-CTERM system associated)